MRLPFLHRRTATKAMTALAATVLVGTAAACSSAAGSTPSASGQDGGGDAAKPATTVHLGYFPNLTHATALVGVGKGYFSKELAKDNATLQTAQFDSGSDADQALLSGSLDATYIGPSPAITAFTESHGAVRAIAGAASGGVALVVAPSIHSVADLRGTTIATPGPGNTQDVAARYYLAKHGLHTTLDGTGGDLTILPQDNSVTLQAFKQGDIAGGWLPEPYASQLVLDDGAKRLVDEASLWPKGQFVTTLLLVRKEFLDQRPDLVRDLLRAHIESNAFINAHPAAAERVVSAQLTRLSAAIDPKVLTSAWQHLTFTNDPIASSLLVGARHAESVGLLKKGTSLDGLFDLRPLNQLLKQRGEPEVSGP